MTGEEAGRVDGASPTAEATAALMVLLSGAHRSPTGALREVVAAAAHLLGAGAGRVLIADYALVTLQELGGDGPVGASLPIEGTLAGRALIRAETVVSVDEPKVWAPLAEGSEQLGVLELSDVTWSDEMEAVLAPIVRVVSLVLISKRRYTDVVHRARRSQTLSIAAEMQWDLLPPLSCSSAGASISGILEPAYSIGGDSFDYAMNEHHLGFAIVDAVGHGRSSVLISTAAVNSLRNGRRESTGLEEAYRSTDEVLRSRFGHSHFVTGQFGTLDYDTGALTWLNAGHPLPLLVRDGSYVGEMACRPSLPMGLGDSVTEIATEDLQPDDRVLFYTDGVIETRSTDGEQFGPARLADFLVRATLDQMSPAETVRRLSASIMAHDSEFRADDATLMLIEYHGPPDRS